MTPQEIKRKIFAQYPPEQNHLAKAEWDKFRQQKYEHDTAAKRTHWERDFPAHIVAWARNEFQQIIEKHRFDYVDNFRVARITKPALGKKRYRRQLLIGCCGYYDTKRVGPDGHTYKLGFNHGH